MKKINYEGIIPPFIGPKLAYHGFEYDQNRSYPPQGHYSFTRNYWCTSQCVALGPIEYDAETVEVGIAQNADFPTEVPQSLLLNQETGFRLWLSNKYILASLQSEHRGVDLGPNQGIIWKTEAPANNEEFVSRLKAGPAFQPGRVLPTWWEFNGEDGLRRVLSEIVQITVTDGLEWFDRQVRDVRRHHEKLDLRRQAVKKREP